jgi:uncharacterized membrane protein
MYEPPSFWRDNRASVAVSSALFISVVIGVAAIGVDIGKVFLDRRKAQNVADMAAIAAVSDLSNADRAANATIKRNNVPDASYTLTYGIYTPDPGVPASQRFKTASSASANAAQVILHTTTPLFFGKALIGRDKFNVNTTATATRTGFAMFAIGSRLVSISGGVLNQMLGALLGANLSLSAMDYQSLISTQIDLFGFMNALATRLQLTGVTYSSILNANAKVSDVLGAMIDTEKQQYGSQNAAVRALMSVADAVGSPSTKISVGSLLDLGPYDGMTTGQSPKVGATLSTLDVLSATAQLANGQHQVQVGLNLNIPGLAAVTLKVTVGERPKGTSWVTVGSTGASVYTAQTRILLTAQLAGTPPASIVNVPIYVDIASGAAKLTALTCGFPDISTSSVTLGVTPGIVDAWIADVSDAQFNNFTSRPNPPAATLVNIGLLQVTGRAHVSVANMTATPVTFSYSDIQRQTKKTVSTQDFTTSLVTRLLGDLQLNVAGVSLGGGAVSSLVASTLSAATSPLDQALSTVLTTLGVGLGQADVWVQNIRCDGAVLVL